MSVDCKGQLLWVPGRSALRQSYSARRLSATEAGLLCIPYASESSQPFGTTAAQTAWVCTLLDGWPVLKASCCLLCCIVNEAGLHQHQLRCTFCHRKAVRHRLLLSLLWLGAGRGGSSSFPC